MSDNLLTKSEQCQMCKKYFIMKELFKVPIRDREINEIINYYFCDECAQFSLKLYFEEYKDIHEYD